MHIVQRVPRRVHRRMYLASERGVVNGVGLGEVDGLFNFNKMFTRMFTIKKHSFDFKNILSGIGSVILTAATMGFAPKVSSQRSKASEFVGGMTVPAASLLPQKWTGITNTERTGGYVGLAVGAAVVAPMVIGAMLPEVGGTLLATGGTAAAESGGMMAAGAGVLAPAAESGGMMAAGAGVLAPAAESSLFALPTFSSAGAMMSAGSGVLAPAAVASTGSGFLATAGSVLSTVGSVIGGLLGGGGGQQQQQQGGMTQAEYDAMQAQAQQQAAYNAQVQAQAQQATMYTPGGMPISYVPETGPPSMTGMNASYGDLRSPYTAIAEDGSTVQVDPTTGQIVPEGMSMPMMIGIGGIVVLGGWYLMSGSKSTN